jgi:hypothetical protein
VRCAVVAVPLLRAVAPGATKGEGAACARAALWLRLHPVQPNAKERPLTRSLLHPVRQAANETALVRLICEGTQVSTGLGCVRLGRRSAGRRPAVGVKVERPTGRTTLTPARTGARWLATEPVGWSGHRPTSRCSGSADAPCVRCSPSLIWVRGPARAGDMMADGGSPRRDARPLSLCGTTAEVGGDRRMAGAGRGHQRVGRGAHAGDRWAQAARGSAAAGSQAASPRARSVWQQRRTSLRATARVGRLPPRRAPRAA